MNTSEKTEKVRLDKWLWAARFFKTRSLATEAINGGKVHVEGQRVKPSREVHPGQTLTVRTGYLERTVVVRALSTRRGPAPEAAKLYEETEESVERRENEAARRKAEHAFRDPGSGRPTKKERRQIHRFLRNP